MSQGQQSELQAEVGTDRLEHKTLTLLTREEKVA